MRHLLALLFILFLTVPSGTKAAAVTLESAYEGCSFWKNTNFTDEVEGAFCIGMTAMLSDIARMNCVYAQELGQEVDPILSAYGMYSGYSLKQQALAIMNYAEKNPKEWETPILFLGSRIATDADFVCQQIEQ